MKSHTTVMFLSILLAYTVNGESILETKTVSTDFAATYKSWPVASQEVTFKVRAPHDAIVVLSTEPEGEYYCYEILFGAENNTRTLLRRDNVIDESDLAEAETPNILNENEFVSLWVSWKKGVIKAGEQNLEKPLFVYEDPNFIFPIRYFGVTTRKSAIGDWKIDRIPVAGVRKPLPPSSSIVSTKPSPSTTMIPLMTPPPTTTTGFDTLTTPTSDALNMGPFWVATDSDELVVPLLAIAAGNTSNGEEVYIARALLKNAFGEGNDTLLPGKLVPSMRLASVAFHHKAHTFRKFEVLCGDPDSVRWVSTKNDEIPPTAIPGGFSHKGETLYVCRVEINKTKIPGKVHPSLSSCYIAVGQYEDYKSEYEILVLN